MLDTIRALLDSDTCSILLLDEERHELVAYAAAGIEEELAAAFRIPVGKGFAGRVAADLRPVVLPDVEHADVLNPLIRRKGIASLAGVPLVFDGRPIGVLHVGTLQRRDFSKGRGRPAPAGRRPRRDRALPCAGASSRSGRRAGGSRTCRRSWTPASPISSSTRF